MGHVDARERFLARSFPSGPAAVVGGATSSTGIAVHCACPCGSPTAPYARAPPRSRSLAPTLALATAVDAAVPMMQGQPAGRRRTRRTRVPCTFAPRRNAPLWKRAARSDGLRARRARRQRRARRFRRRRRLCGHRAGSASRDAESEAAGGGSGGGGGGGGGGSRLKGVADDGAAAAAPDDDGASRGLGVRRRGGGGGCAAPVDEGPAEHGEHGHGDADTGADARRRAV